MAPSSLWKPPPSDLCSNGWLTRLTSSMNASSSICRPCGGPAFNSEVGVVGGFATPSDQAPSPSPEDHRRPCLATLPGCGGEGSTSSVGGILAAHFRCLNCPSLLRPRLNALSGDSSSMDCVVAGVGGGDGCGESGGSLSSRSEFGRGIFRVRCIGDSSGSSSTGSSTARTFVFEMRSRSVDKFTAASRSFDGRG